MSDSNLPTPRGLSQLDPGGVLKNSHEQKAEALRTIDIDNIVGSFFSRADVTYNPQGSATSATFYYDKTRHITKVTAIADVSGSLDGKYFLLDTELGNNKFYVWYNVDGANNDPSIVGRTGIEVAINSNDSAAIVALATRNVLQLYPYFTLNIPTGITDITIVIGNIENGVSDGAVEGDTGFTFTLNQTGVSEVVKEITLPYLNGVKYVYNEYEKTFDIFPTQTVSVELADRGKTPTVINQTLTLASTEYNIALPDGTKKFILSARDNDVTLKLRYASSSTYLTIRRGVAYEEKDIETLSVTLYIESDKPNKIVELVYWT